MKKVIGLMAICLLAHGAFSQDSMNKKMDNPPDKMNKKMENKTDKMNKKLENVPQNKGVIIAPPKKRSGTKVRKDTAQ